MSIVVLGATGGTGRQIVSRALTDGHQVRALARTPDTANLPTHPRLQVVRADVHDHDSITAAIGSDDIVLSGLGVPARGAAGTLTAGATAVTAAHPARIVWLGAAGTGQSATRTNAGIAWLLRKGFGAEYDDKVTADNTVLDAGGIVIHSGPLSDKPDDAAVTLEPVAQSPRRFFPYGAPRAAIARLMLELATAQQPATGLHVMGRRDMH